MSSIVTDQGIVHYEANGRGKPVILLHGWIGSWGYWQDTMTCLKDNFRGYALDFWGFGDSNKARDTYQIDDYVNLVNQFMDRLGIDSAPIIGHSMGGTVALSLALTYPERVQRVVVVGSPITGKSLSVFLQLAGNPHIAALLWKFPFLLPFFLKLYSPFVVNAPQEWYNIVTKDVDKTTQQSFFSSIQSLHYTDLRPRLSEINVPTMGIYGLSDVIVSPYQAKFLSQLVHRSQVAMMAGSGHFPMFDEPDLFNQHLVDFLSREF